MDAAKKMQLQQAAVGALLLVFLWTFLGALRSTRGSRTPPPSQLPQGLSAELPAVIDRFHRQLDQEQQAAMPPQRAVAPAEIVSYTAKGLRDPMVSLLPKPVQESAVGQPGGAAAPSPKAAPRAPSPPAVTVEGIIWGGTRPQAIIRGKVYDVGDTVDGVTITAIDEDGVKVVAAGTTFSLTTAVANEGRPAWR